MRYLVAAPALIALAIAAPAPAQDAAKPASPATAAAQKAIAAALPAEDGRDEAFAARGFLATGSDPLIRNAQGQPVWNTQAYDWVKGEAPATVNPSLWREMKMLRHHGLFQVADGVWQVRGYDLSNMTVIRGATGWILIDPLTTRETAAVALKLVNDTLGQRPVVAVIYSHSHADHFGGVRGVIDQKDVDAGKVQVIAPEHFMAEAASENVMAGGAMARRSGYQFGAGLVPGPQGQMGSGIGMAVSGGTISLIAPTDTITHTGETRTVDGVPLEFQIVSGSEAPSEMNVYVKPARTFLAAEIATCTLHNILTPRGAKVRDAHVWAAYLDEAATKYAPESDVMISSHCWPRWGTAEVERTLGAQRDNYRYMHDQTVRLMNLGETPVEIAQDLKQPPQIAGDWFNHGYYGTYSHNSKAIYQFYLGWYDAVPANLDPLPPVERAKRLVAAIGGADKVKAQAKTAMAAGDYRWSSELLQNLVFALPDDAAARGLLADSYEQQGYQSESAIWRNQFLAAAFELRKGPVERFRPQSEDLIAAVPTQMLLDSVATRYDPARLAWPLVAVKLDITDRKESFTIHADKTVLIARPDMPTGKDTAAILHGPRRLMLALFFLKVPLDKLEMAGLQVEGDPDAVNALQAALDPVPQGFDIVTP